MLQLPRSWPYSHAFLPVPALVADFSAGVRRSGSNQASMAATLADSATLAGESCRSSHASGLPAARSCARARWVNPVPNRFRYSRSRDVADSTWAGATAVQKDDAL